MPFSVSPVKVGFDGLMCLALYSGSFPDTGFGVQSYQSLEGINSPGSSCRYPVCAPSIWLVVRRGRTRMDVAQLVARGNMPRSPVQARPSTTDG